MSQITVAPATEAEGPACLALLPSLQDAAAELIVARQGDQLLGAAGVIWRNRRDAAGFPLEVSVVPQHRRRGVGRRLVEASQALIQGEAEGLWSREALDETAPAAAFARACGFEAKGREHHFRAEVARFSDYVGPLAAGLRARGRIPAQVRIVPLREAPLQEAAWLISAEFGSGPGRALERLQSQGEGAIDLDRSRAIMDGDQVAAVVFGRWEADCPLIDGVVVATAWRKGWANALVVQAMIEVGQEGGARQVRFHCREEVADTMKLARRVEAVCERTAAFYYRAATAG